MGSRDITRSIAGLILSGGYSSRMGRDKALLPFGKHHTFLSYTYHKLGRLIPSIFVSIRNDQEKTYSGLYPNYRFVSDEENGWEGPLKGILSLHSILKKEGEEASVLVMPVDMPYVYSKTLSELILRFQSSGKSVFYKTDEGLEPLCGLYDFSLLSSWQEEENRIEFSPKRRLENSTIECLELSTRERARFRNLNFPKDLKTKG